MESYNGILCTKTDALYLIQAARNNLIPLINQRFSSYERQTYIKSGSIFIWCENKSNIKRWTDGRKWSASRVSGVFLSYKEMKPTKSSTCHIVDEKDNGLLKQSFSYSVGNEKYHIISYITSEVNDIDNNNNNNNGNRDNKLLNYQRPSLDKRFQDLQVDELLKQDSDCQMSYIDRLKRKSLTLNNNNNNEDDFHYNDNSDEYGHINKRRNLSSSSISSSLSSTPSSPKSPLPSLTKSIPSISTYQFTSKPIILPPLQQLIPYIVTDISNNDSDNAIQQDNNNNNDNINKRICDFDRDALLALKCSFS